MFRSCEFCLLPHTPLRSRGRWGACGAHPTGDPRGGVPCFTLSLPWNILAHLPAPLWWAAGPQEPSGARCSSLGPIWRPDRDQGQSSPYPLPPAFLLRGAPLGRPSSRGRIQSLGGRERITGVPVASQEEALSTGNARGTPESCHHSKSPLDLSPFQRNLFSLHYLDFHAEVRLTPRRHVGQPSGIASW